MFLGTCADLEHLVYDLKRYVFSLGGAVVPHEKVMHLDALGAIRWAAMEQRDWFHRIDFERMEECAANVAKPSLSVSSLDVHEQVIADARKNDSVLAGKIVEAEMLADIELSEGLEPLMQLERAKGHSREMTRDEKRLMKKILKNDDREKGLRERAAFKEAAPEEGEMD